MMVPARRERDGVRERWQRSWTGESDNACGAALTAGGRVKRKLEVVVRRLGLAAHEAQRVLLEVDVVADRVRALHLRRLLDGASEVANVAHLRAHTIEEKFLHLRHWYPLLRVLALPE